MDKAHIINYLDESGIDKVKFAVADIDGILRGKTIHRNKLVDGLESGISFCDVVFGWDSADELYDRNKVTGWHTGFPDRVCRIDHSTFRKIPWEGNVPFFLADFSGEDGNHLAVCPRSLLKRIAAKCANMGYRPQFAQEFEWFNFEETPHSIHAKDFRQLKPISPGMFGYSIIRPSLYSDYNNELFELLGKFDVPLEGLHTETGPGVYEAAYMYDDVLRAADKAVLLKLGVKEIAYRHGIMASFMAKWSHDLPGCSGHVHQSLWNPDKSRNLFYNPDASDNMSDLFRSYVAGQLLCLPHILPMFAPTVNSYKRLVEGTWAPTTVTWGIDNRTTALRVINDSEKAIRVEHRVAGADCNPYLTLAACLAAGLYGISNNLKLEMPYTSGSAYAGDANAKLPATLYDASLAMQQSDIARELFGTDFVEHFVNSRLWEWRRFSSQVTDWELKRYFEII